MKNLIKAVLAVMGEVKGIDKDMNVGTGYSSYKGVSDKAVKLKIGASMLKNGLIILPTDIQVKETVTTWDEPTQNGVKRKTSVFTSATTKYLLAHESGESVELAGYGQGVDSQDKGAGKATTYALKYALLYSFLVATGHIEDTDNTHSDEIENPLVSWADALSEIKTIEQLTIFYNSNKGIADSEPQIKLQFKARRIEIEKSLTKK